MLKQHAKLVSRFLYFADLGTILASFYAAYLIRASFLTKWNFTDLYSLEMYVGILSFIIPVWSILLHYYGVYKSQRTVSFPAEMKLISKSVLTGGLFLGAVAFALKSYYLSRTLIVIFIATNLIFLTIERFIIREISWMVRKSGYNYRNVAIVGINKTASDVLHRIMNSDYWGWRVVGFIAENGETDQSQLVDGQRIIGNLRDMERIVKEQVIDDVIFAVSGKRLEELEDTLLMLEDNGINARIVANMFPHVIAKLHLEELESVPLLTFTTTPTSDLALMVKRAFDIVVAALLFIGMLPVMLIAAGLIKMTSPGPVLFRQKRSGLHGRIFTLYKFRSMYIDAEAKKKDLEALNEMDGPVFKIKDDPRVTPIGRFIRQTSIDELPQLWNVLKGDMSIVGPRPPIPDEVALYKRWQRRRLSMRPGLTCLWQISGRNKVSSFDEWAKLDLRYIDTWSLGLDMKIFLKTIPVVLFRKGAA